MRDNPLEVYSITPGVDFIVISAGVEHLDAATAALKFTPITAKEIVCKPRTQLVADARNHYQSISHNRYSASDVSQRWSGTAVIEHAIADPC